ncbi:MAG: hypothetical protein AAF596_07795, partial [Planctomycetota bacterium]
EPFENHIALYLESRRRRWIDWSIDNPALAQAVWPLVMRIWQSEKRIHMRLRSFNCWSAGAMVLFLAEKSGDAVELEERIDDYLIDGMPSLRSYVDSFGGLASTDGARGGHLAAGEAP